MHCKGSDDQEMMNGREQKCSRFFLLDKNLTWSLDLKGGFYHSRERSLKAHNGFSTNISVHSKEILPWAFF